MKFFAGHDRRLKTDKTGTGPLEEGAACEDFLQAVWPMLVFIIVYQILLWGMERALQYGNQMLQAGGASAQVLAFQYAHAADEQALIAAVGMSITLTVVLRLCCRPGEIGLTRHLGASWQKVFLAAVSILCGAVALNLLISHAVTEGFSAGSRAAGQTLNQTAAGVESMQRQTGDVALWLGILVYGCLTPLAEECIFRGITLRRLYKTFLMQRLPQGSVSETDPEAAASCINETEQKRAWLWAAALSSLFFGMYHGNLAQGIYAACAGFVFCRFLVLTENLGAAAVLHGAINTAVLLLEQSGNWDGVHFLPFLAALVGTAACSGAAAHRCGW